MLTEETRGPSMESWRAPVIRGQGDKEEPEKGAARKGRKNQEGCDALDAPGEPVSGTMITCIKCC